MKIFSIFSKGDEDAQGSYCDQSSQTHHDHTADEHELDNQFTASKERKDEVIILDDFDKKAVNYRLDDSFEPVKHGPKQA